jgi:superfamily I DNA/RNA helicase
VYHHRDIWRDLGGSGDVAEVKYTEEQEQIFDRAGQGWSFVVEAGAGTGKTSTLVEVAKRMPAASSPFSAPRRCLYLAYNREIVQDAKKAFPSQVTCSTAHGLAFRAIGRDYAEVLNFGAIQGWQLAKTLRIGPWKEDEYRLSGPAMASVARNTIKKWARSTDLEMGNGHVAIPDHIISQGARDSFQSTALKHAQRLWILVLKPGQRTFRFDHDWYLKLFSMTGPGGGVPQLEASMLLFDECQDADPVIRSVFEGQSNCQRVAVGDSQQAIYAWRGAENAIKRFRDAGAPMFPLTVSWRFGKHVAEEANRWLEALHGDIRISGNPGIDSRLGAINPEERYATLCSTNAGVLEVAVNAIQSGEKTAIVGCGSEVKRLVAGCEHLQAGRESDHPELIGFGNWTELRDFTESQDCDNPTLRTMVRLSSKYGISELKKTIDSCVDEKDARVITSTAHKSKGRQWDQVRIGSDFSEKALALEEVKIPGKDGKNRKADLRLCYVAVTRARKVLDLGPLAT